jgi:hypothetical protein
VTTHTPESIDLRASVRRRRGIGWGGWLAVAGLVLFGLGVLQIGLAFDAMTVDQPGQWLPIYSALGVIALLIVGLARRWRLAYVAAMAAGLYGLASGLPRLLAGGSLGSWIFDLATIVPSSMVVAGLLIAWRRYWRAEG